MGKSSQKKYLTVRRFGGSGDLGVDISGFCSDKGFNGEWDNYQCKRYDHPLRPSDIWVEIGKIIYYSYILTNSMCINKITGKHNA